MPQPAQATTVTPSPSTPPPVVSNEHFYFTHLRDDSTQNKVLIFNAMNASFGIKWTADFLKYNNNNKTMAKQIRTCKQTHANNKKIYWRKKNYNHNNNLDKY